MPVHASEYFAVAPAHRRRESCSPRMPEEFHCKRYLESDFTPLAIILYQH